MGYQHNHLHEARHAIAAAKRDSHGEDIKLNIPADDNKYRFIHVAGQVNEKAEDNQIDNVVTVTRKVYVTEAKTFDGPAVYVTKTPVTITTGMNSYESAKQLQHQTQNSYESAKSVINQPKTRPSNPYGATAVKGTPLSDGQISQQSNGMSGGEKAGVAFGVIAAIGLVAGLLLFCIRRRKKQIANRGERLDEKHVSKASFFSGTAAAVGAPAGDKRESVKSVKGFGSTHTASTAPRLSLRPVTQFLPSMLENRKSSAANNNNLNVPAMSEKPRSGSPQNPFADAQTTNPFDEGDGKVDRSMTPSSDATVGTAAAVPVPSGKGQNNVHRVQLDFKPSMEDELELKSGGLVRMLHEYDDGWALCIRMDRTQQGVCPRTCLSKLPVKPRPQGPASQSRPSGSPSGFRGPPPQGPNKMMPRPLTPTGRERSNTARGRDSPSPLETNRVRSQSASSASDRSISPVDSGMPARKPVPGPAA